MSLYRLKNPPPLLFFWGEQNHLRQKADQRLNSCQEQPLSSFSQFFSPALAHFFYICTWYPSFPFTQSPDLTSYFLLYVSPSSFLSCSMHNRVFNQFGESQLSLQIEIFCVLQRDGVGEGEKERETTRKCTTLYLSVQRSKHQVCTGLRPESKTKKKETKGEKQEGVCDGLPSCQKATTDGTACFYLWSQNGLNHFFI